MAKSTPSKAKTPSKDEKKVNGKKRAKVDSDSEDEAPPSVKKQAVVDSSSDSSEDEAPKKKAKASNQPIAKKAKTTKVVVKKEEPDSDSSDESSDESSDSSEDEPPKKANEPKAKNGKATKVVVKKEDSDSSEDEPPKKKANDPKAKNGKPTKPVVKKEDSDSDSSDESSDESSEDDSSEDETPKKKADEPKAKNGKATKVVVKKEGSDSDDESSDEEEIKYLAGMEVPEAKKTKIGMGELRRRRRADTIAARAPIDTSSFPATPSLDLDYDKISEALKQWNTEVVNTPKGLVLREDVINRVQKLLNRIWPDKEEAVVIGSTKTGTFFEFSPVEFSVKAIKPVKPQHVSSVVKRKEHRYFEKANHNIKAQYAKFVDRDTKLDIRISQNADKTVEEGDFMMRSMKTTPVFKPVYSFLFYLRSSKASKMNKDTYIPEHILAVSLLFYIWKFHRNTTSTGKVLVGYLEFFSKMFDAKTMSFRVDDEQNAYLETRTGYSDSINLVAYSPVYGDRNATVAKSGLFRFVQEYYGEVFKAVKKHGFLGGVDDDNKGNDLMSPFVIKKKKTPKIEEKAKSANKRRDARKEIKRQERIAKGLPPDPPVLSVDKQQQNEIRRFQRKIKRTNKQVDRLLNTKGNPKKVAAFELKKKKRLLERDRIQAKLDQYTATMQKKKEAAEN